MLSRRQLRIKALQSLYAFFQSNSDNLQDGEKQLLHSINKLYSLYIFQLDLIIEVVKFGYQRMEEAKNKFYPTDEELHPKMKFYDNQFVKLLEKNKHLEKHINAYRVSWANDQEVVRKLWNQIKESEEYKRYLSIPDTDFNSDKAFIIYLVKNFILPSEFLRSHYEEKSIYWVDDYDISCIMVLKTLKEFDEKSDEFTPLPTIFNTKGKINPDEDKQYLVNLFRKAILRSKYFESLIAARAKNWELDRIAVMDIILIKMALVEFLELPSIPIKVTLNEYIELAKIYSTPKSSIFINGILDKLVNELIAEGLVQKTGRGLINE